jgi:hypothetical protein
MVPMLAAELWLFVRSARCLGFVPLPTLLLAFLMLSQLAGWLVHDGLIINPELLASDLGGFETYYMTTMMLYFVMCLAVISPFPEIFQKNYRQIRIRKVPNINSKTLLIVNYSLSVVYFFYLLAAYFSLRWDLVWSNSVYLTMTFPEEILLPGAQSMAMLINLISLMGIIAAGACAFNLAKGFLRWSVLFGIISALFSLYDLGSHQRGAALEPIVFATLLTALCVPGYHTIKGISYVYALYSFGSALVGRMLNEHGISTIFDIGEIFTIITGGNSFGTTLAGLSSLILTNVTQGFFGISQGFMINYEFPLQYKILAFMPTPSFIDGYDKIKDSIQIFYTPSTPMSGISEVYIFGYPYVILLYFIYYYSARLCKNAEKAGFLGSLSNFILTIGFVMMCAYPLRNGLKLVWAADALSLVVLISEKRRRQGLGLPDGHGAISSAEEA